MIDGGVTSGEQLCKFVNHKLLKSDVWSDLEGILGVTGRSVHLVAFYRQLAAVTLTGRVVAAGRSLSKQFEEGLSGLSGRKAFIEHLRDLVGIPSRHLDELFRHSERAVSASLAKTMPSVEKRMRSWATLRHPKCYICGTGLDFDGQGPEESAYTLEHIWPRTYGGESIEENLLPACYSCNNRKKKDFATWTMPSIQSLLLGISPKEQRLQEIDGSYKFSLHYRAAQRIAMEDRSSLKQAFLKIGPWTDVRLLDVDDVADFFNLENHTLQ